MPNKTKDQNPIHHLENGCWEWHGSLDAYGHPIASGGLFTGDPTKIPGRIYRVRQVTFENLHGYSPKRLTNTCGNQLCVNPDHMVDTKKSKFDQAKGALLSKTNLRIIELELQLEGLKFAQGKEVDEYKAILEKELIQKREEVKAYEGPTSSGIEETNPPSQDKGGDSNPS